MPRLRILPQPDDNTCGPTALQAVYAHLGLDMPLDQVIQEVHALEDGGTLAVFLGLHALKQGFHARIHSYNLRVFDPTWEGLPGEVLRKKLVAQTRFKDGKKLTAACLAYARFLKMGGEVRFDDPTPDLLRDYLDRDLPILTGLSATYLYRSKREHPGANGQSVFDDLRGKPMGHFVVLTSMEGKTVHVADPYMDNPYSREHHYPVHVGRLINSIMLGIVTYDANMLILSRSPLPPPLVKERAPEASEPLREPMRKIIVVREPREFHLGLSGVEVVSSKDYLTDPTYAALRNVRIFNLARSYSYQSRGYYVSLLAEARGHKVIPDAKSILDLRSPRLVKVLGRDLHGLIQQQLADKKKDQFDLSIYFGRNVNRRYDRLAHELYKVFRSPLLRARFQRTGGEWELRTIRPIPYNDIPEDHLPFLRRFASEYFAKKRYDRAREDHSSYDLAILVNPEDQASPSNKRAVVKFRQAAESLGFKVDILGPDDIDRVGEYDALFIRENTHVDHHTYRFARKAQKEGLAVMDAPDAILKCNNKVFLAEVMEAHDVPTPRTLIVHAENRQEVIARFGLPVVLKLPDSTFSRGVTKAHNPEELERKLDELLSESDLVIAQEFMPSDFDWRVGVLDGRPLYACKYFMARGHWQIYNWSSGTKKDQTGDFATLPVDQAPKAIVDAAVKAVLAVVGDQGLFGVDVKERDGRPYVIEVNECPNIDHGVEDVVLGEALYEAIICSLKHRIERRIGIRPTAAPAAPAQRK